uniref:Uncharacterized protein n=1 Tax=Anguilla anguilla TaxID=7936 RepID=A0A0E9X5Z9_ANGAN
MLQLFFLVVMQFLKQQGLNHFFLHLFFCLIIAHMIVQPTFKLKLTCQKNTSVITGNKSEVRNKLQWNAVMQKMWNVVWSKGPAACSVYKHRDFLFPLSSTWWYSQKKKPLHKKQNVRNHYFKKIKIPLSITLSEYKCR